MIKSDGLKDMEDRIALLERRLKGKQNDGWQVESVSPDFGKVNDTESYIDRWAKVLDKWNHIESQLHLLKKFYAKFVSIDSDGMKRFVEGVSSKETVKGENETKSNEEEDHNSEDFTELSKDQIAISNLLTLASKRELILGSSDNIKKVCYYSEKIDALSEYVQFPFLSKLSSMTVELKQIETKDIGQKLMAHDSRIKEIIENYNQYIDIVSQKCILYDEMLKKLESTLLSD